MRNNKRFDKIGTEKKQNSADEKSEKTGFRQSIGESLDAFREENSPRWRDENGSGRFSYAKKKKTEKRTSRTEEVQPSPKAPFVLLLCCLCLSAAGAFFLGSDFVYGLDFKYRCIAKIIVTAAAYGLPTAVFLIMRKNTGGVGFKSFSVKLTPFILLSLGLILCSSALQKYVIAYLFTYRVQQGAAEGTLAMSVLTQALVPAIFEELLVRGVLQHEFSRYAGGLGGVAVSSLAFALLHFDLRFFGVYLAAGLVIGAVCHVTGSVFPAMLVHFLNNFLSIAFSDELTFVALERIGGTLLIIVLASLCFIFLIFLLKAAEKISVDRATELLKAEENGDEDKKMHGDVIIFKNASGKTLFRTVKLFINPVFTVCIGFFVVCVVFLMK